MTTFSDDFNRADSTTVGNGWVEVAEDWAIVGNRLAAPASGGTGVIVCGTPMATDDNAAQVTIAAASAVSCGVFCRADTAFGNGYLWRNDGTSWDLFRNVSGSFTALATFAGAAANGDVAKVQAVGTTIKAFVNGVERASVTDSSIATGKNTGMRCAASSTVRYDDFSAADATAGSNVPGTIGQAYGGLGGGVTAVREVPGAVSQSFGGLGGGVAGTREVIASVAQAYGGLSGGVVGGREVPATVTQAMGALSGGATGVRETAGGIAFVGGALGGGVVVPSGSLLPATTTQVVLAWLRQFAGYSNSATVVPELAGWVDLGYFVRVAGVVGGSPGLDLPENRPVVQVEVYAANRVAAGAKTSSRKIPRGRAEARTIDISNLTHTTPSGLDLTLPADYRPVWIETIYPVGDVRELPDPAPNVARYSVDIFVGWIERDPVG